MIAIDTSRWNATIQGLRSVSTVMPPITAWAGMPRATTVASTRRRRRPARATSAAQAAQQATASATSTKVSIRLPNSIAPWMPSSPCAT